MSELNETVGSGLASYYEYVAGHLHKWVDPLSNEQFWRKPYPYGNSIGHLVLHLTGNLNYYVGARVAATDTGRCPLFLLTGEYDFSCTPADTLRTAASIDGAQVVIMEQLGHFPMSENPAQFRRYIAPILDRIVQNAATATQHPAD